MNQSNILDQVIEVVRQVQEASGRAVGDIRPDTRPVGDIDGFDSLSGVEASALLSEALGFEVSDNAFVSEHGRGALSVNEIAGNVNGQLRLGRAIN